MNDDVCRICRGEETPSEPLFHPCRCAGSIKYVHEECLLEWLQHARVRTKCDVCGTDYVLRKKYKPSMSETLRVADYLGFALQSANQYWTVLYYTVRGVLMVSFAAVATKYTLEVAVIWVEQGENSATSREMLRRMRSQPPRESVAPILDSVADLVWPATELRTAWINGLVMLVAFICVTLFAWFMAMWVLNEYALLHDIEHIELGEMSHMDQGDDEDLLADLHLHNNLPETHGRLHEGDADGEGNDRNRNNNNNAHANGNRNERRGRPANAEAAPGEDGNNNEGNENNNDAESLAETVDGDPEVEIEEEEGEDVDGDNLAENEEVVVEFNPRADIYEDLRPEHVVRMEEDEMLGLDEDDGAEEIGVFLRRLVVDLFAGPNAVILAGFCSTTLVFCTFAMCYGAVYGAELFLRYIAVRGMERALGLLAVPERYITTMSETLRVRPQTVAGHLTLDLVMGGILLTIARLIVLSNMRWLLRRTWGRTLAIFAYEVYAVVKTLLMTGVETLVFPQFCGFLLHLAVLPITPPWQWHVEQYNRYPYATLFLQWLTGYLYMHAFQTFVSACRKGFRKGVLFFLHDNDPVYFMRSIMLLSVPKQLRRILTSAGIYGVFILLGVGSACLALRLLEPSAWPLELTHWPGAQVLRLWPALVVAGALSAPLTRSGKQLKVVLSLWLTERVWLRMFAELAALLDLSSYLFAKPRVLTPEETEKLSNWDTSAGCFVRAPVEFPLRPRRSLNLFIPVTQTNVRLDGKSGVQPNELTKYTLVWRPPHFRRRLCMLALGSWAVVTVVTLLFTLVPLRVGRLVDAVLCNGEIRNDLVLGAAGLGLCLPIYAQLLRRFTPRELGLCVRFMAVFGDLPQPQKAQMPAAAFWAMCFSILSTSPAAPWHHWLVFDERRVAAPSGGGRGLGSLLTGAAAQLLAVRVANFLAFFIGNLYSGAWLRATATADFFIWQVCLEALGLVPRSGEPIFVCAFLCAALRLGHKWYHSASAAQLSVLVREAIYLDKLEVRNYEGPAPSQAKVEPPS